MAPARQPAKEYWVTRVVRSMQGCSPSRIDSVIQANLPPRRIHWSQRPDTLEIPGLPGRIPYSPDNIPKCYKLGYFSDSPFLHPELQVKPGGMPSDIHPYHMSNDSNIVATMVVCLVLLTSVVRHLRRFIAYQSHSFFQPRLHSRQHMSDQTTSDFLSTLLSMGILGCVVATLYLYYVQSSVDVFLCYLQQYHLLGIFSISTVLSLIVQRVLTLFINWIFFNKENRQEWRQASIYLMLLQTTLLLPIVFVGIILHIEPMQLALASLIVVTIFKLGLIYKTFVTFSFKFYGILHLLSYLCALEIIPLLVLWEVLTSTTNSLTITF